jgi:hypothetical protein
LQRRKVFPVSYGTYNVVTKREKSSKWTLIS